jgi:hypothetical protein
LNGLGGLKSFGDSRKHEKKPTARSAFQTNNLTITWMQLVPKQPEPESKLPVRKRTEQQRQPVPKQPVPKQPE